jgi:uncharacterized membrane protein
MPLIKKYWDKIILILLILSYTTIVGKLTINRHNAFASGFDLGNADQTVWNTFQGRFFTLTNESQNISRFSIHADLILIFFAPLFFIWDNVRILLLVQTVALALGAIPLYLLANKVLRNRLISILIVCFYLLNPGLLWTNVYDFHAVAFVIPLLIFSFYFAYSKQWLWYWLTIFLSLMTKEQISVTIILFGILIFFFFKEKNRFINYHNWFFMVYFNGV